VLVSDGLLISDGDLFGSNIMTGRPARDDGLVADGLKSSMMIMALGDNTACMH